MTGRIDLSSRLAVIAGFPTTGKSWLAKHSNEIDPRLVVYDMESTDFRNLYGGDSGVAMVNRAHDWEYSYAHEICRMYENAADNITECESDRDKIVLILTSAHDKVRTEIMNSVISDHDDYLYYVIPGPRRLLQSLQLAGKRLNDPDSTQPMESRVRAFEFLRDRAMPTLTETLRTKASRPREILIQLGDNEYLSDAVKVALQDCEV